MGESVSPLARGTFYLLTDKEPPYFVALNQTMVKIAFNKRKYSKNQFCFSFNYKNYIMQSRPAFGFFSVKI